MKHSVLKTIQTFAVAALILCIGISCKKQSSPYNGDLTKNGTTNSSKFGGPQDITTPNPFNKRVGAPVDGLVGDQWIANFKKVKGYNKTYTLSNAAVQAIVAQPNCVGISLTYALDDKNNAHILLIGVDFNGKIMKSDYVSTINGNISWATAQQWIAKDKGAINSHFLGSSTFARLNENPCKIIKVDYAIDDKNKQQLLLSNPCVLNLNKQYEDHTAICPTACPTP
jgi:hypothetical protein